MGGLHSSLLTIVLSAPSLPVICPSIQYKQKRVFSDKTMITGGFVNLKCIITEEIKKMANYYYQSTVIIWLV